MQRLIGDGESLRQVGPFFSNIRQQCKARLRERERDLLCNTKALLEKKSRQRICLNIYRRCIQLFYFNLRRQSHVSVVANVLLPESIAVGVDEEGHLGPLQLHSRNHFAKISGYRHLQKIIRIYAYI